MLYLILGALGLESDRASKELATLLTKAIGPKTLQRGMPVLVEKLAGDGQLEEGQRRQVASLAKRKLPKELVNLSPQDFQQRLAKLGLGAPLASRLYLIAQLELLGQLEGQVQVVANLARKATKKRWPGAQEVEKLQGDWPGVLQRRRYEIAHRLELLSGRGGGAPSGAPQPGGLEPAPPQPSPAETSTLEELAPAPLPGPAEPSGERETGLPELEELKPLAREKPTPAAQPTPADPATHPARPDRAHQRSFPGNRYKLFVGGKGIPIHYFDDKGGGRGVVGTGKPHPLLDEWLASGDPKVLYVVEKEGGQTIPLQGCRVMERSVIYKLAYREEE